MSEYVEEAFTDEAEPDIVHWMEPRPLSLGPGGVSAAAAGAFALGVAATLVVLALTHWLSPPERLEVRRR